MKKINHNMFYKYYSFTNENKFNTIKNLLTKDEIYFSSLKMFNDPFECNPYCNIINPPPSSGLNKIPLKANFIKTLKSYVNNKGAYCVTKCKKNILLWSHYTDSHSGICVGFEYDANKQTLHKINYSVLYPKISNTDFDFPINSGNETRHLYASLYQKILFTKAKIWKYEEEYRLIEDIRSNKKSSLKKPPPSQGKIFKASDKGLILKEINFGVNIEKCNKSKFLELRRKMNLKLNIYDVKIDKETFKLNFFKKKESQ